MDFIVKVERLKLLEIVTKNAANHKRTFDEAHAEYRRQVVAKYREYALQAEAGGEVHTYIHLEAPEDHTKAYERVVGMLKMSQEAELHITETQYQEYVDDEWGWKPKFNFTSSSYLAQRR